MDQTDTFSNILSFSEMTRSTSKDIPPLPVSPNLGLHLQKTVLAVQRLRVEHSRVVELSSKLVQERLDLEQQLEDMQATHQTKMEQMSSRVKQLGSCQVEQLSGVGAAVIQDVKMLRQQFRQARQEVDSLEDKLKEMEKKVTNVKEASNREKEDQLILERLGNQLKYNMKKLEEEQIMLGQVLQAGREANNHLHQDRVEMERMARLVEDENRELEDRVWEKDTASEVGVKYLEKVKVEVVGDEEAAANTEAEENRLEVVLGEKLCELESVQNCVEGAQKVVAQMMTCSIREEGDMMVEMELEEMMRLWVEEKRDMEVELQSFRIKVVSLEDLKLERENVLKKEEEDENGEKLGVGEEIERGDGSKEIGEYDGKEEDKKGEKVEEGLADIGGLTDEN